MRPIKFRAWDKNNKVMYDRVLAGCNQSNSDSYICNLVWMESKKDWVHFDEFCGEIMQYTGLKDRNGVEIYEGDILARKPFSHWVVEFNDGGFVFYNAVNPIQSWMNLCQGNASEREVIGNIYENPELLGGESNA